MALYQKFLNDTKRKNQFLIERKVKHAKGIDYLLNFDNRIEKMFDYKKCFLHDVFLKIALDQTEGGSEQVEVSEESIKQLLQTSASA